MISSLSYLSLAYITLFLISVLICLVAVFLVNILWSKLNDEIHIYILQEEEKKKH